MPDNGSAPDSISRRPAPWRSVGIGGLRPAKRCDRGLALAELFTNGAEREPGRGKVRRKLDRLQQQIGGGGEVAFQLQIAREIEPPVGHQVAGGQEQARRHLGNRFNVRGQVAARLE